MMDEKQKGAHIRVLSSKRCKWYRNVSWYSQI